MTAVPSGPKSPREKLHALDGLRGLAASWVVLHHMATNALLPQVPLLMHGWMLVETFFVLSGFVICYQYGSRLASPGQIASFMQRRFARIWPLHAAILFAMILPRLVVLALHGPASSQLFEPDSTHSLASWFASLALIQSLGLDQHAVWNGPAWSISVEFYTYLIFAAVVFFARERLRSVAVVLAVVAGAMLLLPMPTPEHLLICIFCFFVGVLAFDAYSRFKPRAVRIQSNLPFSIAQSVLALLILELIYFGENPPLLFGLINMFLIISIAQQRGIIGRMLDLRIFQLLGAWSLGIYLLHIPVLNILWRIGPHIPVSFLKFDPAHWTVIDSAAFLATVVVLAALSYRWLEVPARRALAPRVKPQPAAVEVEKRPTLRMEHDAG
ncbi:acyltransferase [Stakelama sediminis]|uniref:Peptidoglycan/LPS O-acetylase OafA/YrhL n=1 Tax=Stakelama sediminis TaxID=463200 RepID=A0A840Z3P3_9SPHN|nr:acyltransferase [Stakelama sediminis]MBB5720357.1 peptidoglycan/LPS O-acetylase OafA/YrhL [Stakelama sediminis]